MKLDTHTHPLESWATELWTIIWIPKPILVLNLDRGNLLFNVFVFNIDDHPCCDCRIKKKYFSKENNPKTKCDGKKSCE
jgi:hypothetical protein